MFTNLANELRQHLVWDLHICGKTHEKTTRPGLAPRTQTLSDLFADLIGDTEDFAGEATERDESTNVLDSLGRFVIGFERK